MRTDIAVAKLVTVLFTSPDAYNLLTRKGSEKND